MSGIFTDLDLQALRLLLLGGSVVDWRRLSFREPGEVAQFLAANGYDVENSIEMDRLSALHGRALQYLEETYELSIPDRVRTPKDVTELFLTASGVNADQDEQQAACAVLKVIPNEVVFAAGPSPFGPVSLRTRSRRPMATAAVSWSKPARTPSPRIAAPDTYARPPGFRSFSSRSIVAASPKSRLL